MIIKEKLNTPFETCSTKLMICLKCDYCDKEFTKVKRSIILCNKNLNKDSCDDKICRKKKRKEVNEFLKTCASHQEKLKESGYGEFEKLFTTKINSGIGGKPHN